MENHNYDVNKNLVIMIVLYSFILLWALLFKFADLEEIEIIYDNICDMTIKERFLFDIKLFHFTGNIPMQKLEVVLNAIIFAPLGVMLCLKDNKVKIFKHILFCFLFSLVIEVIQLFTCIGGFAIDDLIMNTLGYIIGIPFYVFIFKKLNNKVVSHIYVAINCILTIISIYALITIIDIIPSLMKLLFGIL